MYNCSQLRSLIIEPVLSKLQIYSKEAEEILVFTCAAESLGGYYLKQVKGPALGAYQMEPNTYMDLWLNYIRNKNRLATLMAMHHNVTTIPDANRLVWDLNFSTAMTRIHYLRVKEQLPKADDVDAIWEYYKKYYNTVKGKAEKEESIKKYQKFLKS